jgi:hypothetical protein
MILLICSCNPLLKFSSGFHKLFILKRALPLTLFILNTLQFPTLCHTLQPLVFLFKNTNPHLQWPNLLSLGLNNRIILLILISNRTLQSSILLLQYGLQLRTTLHHLPILLPNTSIVILTLLIAIPLGHHKIIIGQQTLILTLHPLKTKHLSS